ncbi:Ribosomal protein S16, mitochondrial [Lachnellula occidentalis]|uniref:Ribosomal protein S16, mitochondrial n=1 Tax=Lachnellula occidentalis TaxID=215460 RepID=A0A8H8SA70_9HELO|nr:Ribosomal protein S16, mitochondrial [Lachnellula occidentalis]
MVVKIRLARFGRRKAPFYNIVVAQARTARNSKPIEVLGTYDPIPKPPADGEGKPFKDIRLDTARAKYWLGVGAQPSDPAWRLLSMAGLLIPKYRPSATPTPATAASIIPEASVSADKGVNAVV